MSHPRYILFDAVGTLLFPRPGVAEVYARRGRMFGSRLTPADIKQRFGPALAMSETSDRAIDEPGERERWRQIVGDVFDDVPDSTPLFTELWEHFALPQSWALFDDVADTWRALTGRGYVLGVASNFDIRLTQICQGHPPLNACAHVYYSSLLGSAKPQRAFYQAIEKRLGAEPEEILLIGDDPVRDISGAQAAGWQARLIDRDATYRPGEVLTDLRQVVAELPGSL